ncbi:pimeloyl-ACP methyl ester carboxylesterase [Saccharopolyspora erythraea NRRL 2338]|uniref:Alpha/beta hydrolase fold n=2 Tax=Saccharopolyspora erythraea TaxID=1836 RepID=A4FGW0_SACEN|nr:alpha/beta hydrolase [Saccharopolyspora erythraea]EQD82608.1 alpha/beta hydrolase [Saccharopolyspora erythraea D]PFG96989.1 pimeloyl-ACP methyl ester carboxylesterase [Saccharopolyspora erythraea NRRL 2338]QRK87204.1 alpha/beta fold hydrolase [Saccharopolyspora erythraea]CAM03285.1 alpha/beta hydrolase fold [Saccharopolyspora erythraea NRRL 2338]
MPHATTDDGVRLYYEEAGSGVPLVFVHEFAGDHRSWEPQIRHFSRSYRCVVYAARGFPPSDVPGDPAAYGQYRAVDDLAAVLDAIGAESAHVVGNSMGGFCALHFGLRYPSRARSMVVAGCGYGAHPDTQDTFRAESEKVAVAFETDGSAEMAQWYGYGPARVQFENKDPRGHAEHVAVLAEHDPIGAALTMRAVQKARPSLYALRGELAGCQVPALIVAGDEDEGVLETDLMLKRTMPRAGLLVLPRTGHVTNLEEPELFNIHVERFLAQVVNDRWPARDPRSLSTSTTGAK